MIDRYHQYSLAPGPLEVQEIKVMHGANYFSGGRLVVMRLDLGEYDEVFTNEIPGFYERLKELLPSLQEHHCSVGEPGGFFQRIVRGTLLGHVSEHVAIELQTLAGMDVGYGKTRMTSTQGVYNVVFRFLDEMAGIYAAKAAVNLVHSILLNGKFNVEAIVRDLIEIREQRLLGPSTQAIVDEAEQRKIPWLRLDEYNLVQLGTGKYHKRIRATVTSDTNFIAVETSGDPVLSNRMLSDAGIPVPETVPVRSFEDVVALQTRLQAPVVIKPITRGGPGAICTDLQTESEISDALVWVHQYSEGVLAQRFVLGNSFRLLVIDDRFVAAARMDPPAIQGDGQQTIAELIDRLNRAPNRGIGDKTPLTRVEIDDVTQRQLTLHGHTLQTVLPAGVVLPLKVSGNLRGGGSAVAVTEQVHPENRYLAERAARALGLNVAGVDLIAPDLERSILENNGRVIGVSASPDFRPHLNPVSGAKQNVAQPMLDMLFPEDRSSHIPLFSVTGSAGRGLCVRLLASALANTGHTCGRTSRDGLFIGDNRLKQGDRTGPEQVAVVLQDPTINCAVLETPVAGILDRGLGYEKADFGIVLNVAADRPLQDYGVHIENLEDLAYAQSVVVEEVCERGFAILNADDEQVLEMRKRIDCETVLISRTLDNPTIRQHLEERGLAVFMDNGYPVIQAQEQRFELLRMDELELAAGGAESEAVIYPLLAAVAALYCFGLSIDTIDESMRCFLSPG